MVAIEHPDEGVPRQDAVRHANPPRPIVTMAVLGVTALVTIAQFVWPQVLEYLRRTPDALRSGQWWRTFSPLFVHAHGWPHLLFNLFWISATGIVVERRFGPIRWLVLYFVPGVVGEFVGFVWEPRGAGSSLGGFGLLGAFSVWLLLRGQSFPWLIRWWGALIILIAPILIALRDVHGPPLLVGAALGLLMLVWDRKRHPGEEPA